jgi:hypothetical protein
MADAVEFPRAWRFHSDDSDHPADGATFLGRFTGVIETGQSAYGDKPVARFVAEETGEEISIWLFQQALLDQLAKLKPEKGELVKIDYLGKKKSKTSKYSYQSFKASAPERPVVALTWDNLGVPEEELEDD